MYDRADFSTPCGAICLFLVDLLLPSHSRSSAAEKRLPILLDGAALRVGAPAVNHYGSSSPAPAVERRVTAPSHSRMREFT